MLAELLRTPEHSLRRPSEPAMFGRPAIHMPVDPVPGLTPAERRLRTLLRVFVFVFLGAVFLYELGPLVGPFGAFFQQLPFVSNSVVKVSLLMMLCLYASGDVRGRIGLIMILIAAHCVSIIAMLALLTAADTSALVALGPWTLPVGRVLWGAIALDGAIAVLLTAFYVPARRAMPDTEPPTHRAVEKLTAPERWMQRLLYFFGAVFTAAAIGYELGAFLPATRPFFAELPFVTNSVVKVGTLAMLSVYAAAGIRHDLSLAGPVIAAHVISALAQAIFLLALDTGFAVEIAGREFTMTQVLLGSIALDGAIAVLLFAVYQASWKARYGLKFFRPMEYRTLMALAEVNVRRGRALVPYPDVAARVERYIRRIRARRRWVYRLALFGVFLHPLLYAMPPFPEMDEERRLRHLKRHFYRAVLLRLVPDWWRRLIQVMIRVCNQLTYVGYYSDERTFESVGYVPFSKRPGYHDSLKKKPLPLKVDRPADISGHEIDTDVCIIGSGAGGAILAYELAKTGREVLLLERGNYTSQEDFTEDEVEMIGKLYADGIFQQTQDFRFTILQGSCVGGSTVVNNAVCFRAPDHVLAHWNEPRYYDAGLDLARLKESNAYIERFLKVATQVPTHLNPSYPKFTEGAAALVPDMEVDAVRANIRGCVGCGYCNIGCAYGAKLSMLDTALPWAQRDFPGRVRILSECEALRIGTHRDTDSNRASHVQAVLSDGRKIAVHAGTFVVAAGAVASSLILLRSGLGKQLPVGRGLGFNMGTFLTADYDEPLNAYDGLQISHYGLPRPWEGFVFETWWNPPVAQAINMPGWFEDHFENMQRYPHLAAVGVLVGTKGNARVKRALMGGAEVAYKPDSEDLATLGRGLELLGKILFETGARRVIASTWGHDVFTCPTDLSRLREIVQDPSYITLGTGHPQGGNGISTDSARGVVGPDLRVHGYTNLYVCDASVFPSTITVNPQQTVMALAHYAAAGIA